MDRSTDDTEAVERLFPGSTKEHVGALIDSLRQGSHEHARRITALERTIRDEFADTRASLAEIVETLRGLLEEKTAADEERTTRLTDRLEDVARVEQRLIQHVMRAEAQLLVGVRERDEVLRVERERLLIMMIGEVIRHMSEKDRVRFSERISLSLDHFGLGHRNGVVRGA